MKNSFTALFLLLSGLILILATVDLGPYLTNDTAENHQQRKISEPAAPKLPALPDPLEHSEPSEGQAHVPVPDQPSQDEQEKTKQLSHEALLDPAEQEAKTSEEPAVAEEVLETVEEIAENQPTIASTDSDSRENSKTNTQTTEIINTELNRQKNSLNEKKTSTPLIELEVSIVGEGDYPYSILLATFLREETAQKAVPIFKRQKISAHWVKVDLGENNVRYRLFTGAFSTSDEAEAHLEQLQLSDGLVKITRYASRIGVYRDKNQLGQAFQEAEDIGLMPYILGTGKGVFYLYVGAYYTFAGASEQCNMIQLTGLSCRPVSRSTIP